MLDPNPPPRVRGQTSGGGRQTFKLKITNAALRTLDFRGGLDAVLLNSRDEVLSPKALKIKRQVKQKLAAQAAQA